MATKSGNQKSRKSDPMRTKNGKERLGSLNVAQLEKLLANARKKTAPKIQRRIAVIKSRSTYRAPVVVETVAE
jgi:hypothetical protein